MTYVHGHQDDHLDEDELPPEAAINVEMDELAGEHMTRILQANLDTSEPSLFPSLQITIKINNKRVTSNVEDNLIFQYYKHSLYKHYENTVKLNTNEFDNIRWNAFRLTLRDSDKFAQTIKAIHSQWQTKVVCKRWKSTADALCTLCGDADETWQHVLQCPNVHMC